MTEIRSNSLFHTCEKSENCLLTPRKTGIVSVIVAKSDEIGKIATLISCEISRDFAYGHHKRATW